MKPLCDLCGSRHESYQAHVFATNKIATNTSATNKIDAGVGLGLRGLGTGAVEKRVKPAAEGAGDRAVDRTRNRRSRESYNAYQREYMKKRRANKTA